MAISVDWGTRVITVNKADMTLVSTTPYDVYELDVDAFRLALRDLEDNGPGMSYPTTHDHVAPINVGGVFLARVVSIINGYTITFENGTYAASIVGGNSNIADVVNLNNVSIRTNNTAGLVETNLATAILDEPNTIEQGLSLRQAMRLVLAATAGKVSGAATSTITFRSAYADDKDRIVASIDGSGNRTAITIDVSD